ncbi:VWFA domain-containing protein [Entamoeba marina]
MIKTGASHAFLKSEHKDNPQVNEIIEEPKVDVNLISVELNNLNAQCAVQQSSPIYCSSCKAALTNDIVIEDNTWKCQFCSTTQRIEDKQKEGIVKKGTIDYIKEKKEISMNKGGIVVYCIDVSGSMNGSRLESCKAAICEQVKLLKETNPEKMVCVIEFESNVSILGDCTKSPLQINSRMMDDFDSLVDIGKEKVYLDPISVTGDRIIKNVQSMHTKGSTALGPALLLGTVIAGKEVGGQVILCTDGCANQGLGSMCCNEESYKPFYERVTQLAKDKGVIININTISGCNSNLKVLGETAAETYGEIIVVDSSKIYSAFDDALDKKINC